MTRYRPFYLRDQEDKHCRNTKCNKKFKYRDPKTRLRYCSVACYKDIQQDLKDGKIKPAEPVSEKKEATAPAAEGKSPRKGHDTTSEETEVAVDTWSRFNDEDDRLPQERLERLESSEEVKNLLANPHLRQMITYIDTTRNKDRCMEKVMHEPIFVEFADACLKLVESDSSDGEKTPEPKEDIVEVDEFELLQF